MLSSPESKSIAASIINGFKPFTSTLIRAEDLVTS